jgi:dUTPase
MRFAKVLGHARPPIKLNPLDPGLTVFSAESFKLEFGEVHSFRTGIIAEIPEGSFGLLIETHGQGVKGVIVAGGLVTTKWVSELRVSLTNSHREAYEVQAGSQIAQLLILSDAKADDTAEEIDKDTLTEEMKKIVDEAQIEERKVTASQFEPEQKMKSSHKR